MKFLNLFLCLILFYTPSYGVTGTLGKKSINSIIPISQAAKRTKEVALTITSPDVNWATLFAFGRARADSNGIWRLEFNINGSVSVAVSTLILEVNGVVFRSTESNSHQAVTVYTSSMVSNVNRGLALDGSLSTGGDIDIRLASSQSLFYVTGNVILDSEPTWAAANMEGSIDSSVYVEPATPTNDGIMTTTAQSFAGVKTFNDNVGIGTTSPSSYVNWGRLLEISGTTNAGIKFTETDVSDSDYSIGTTGGNFVLWKDNDGDFSPILTANNNKEVGIGATPNGSMLSVQGEGSLGNIMSIYSGTAYQGLTIFGTTDLGVGTIRIEPVTVPGSGTSQQWTYFADRVAGGTTKHNVQIQGALVVESPVGIGTNTSTSQMLRILGLGTTSTTYSFAAANSTGVNQLLVRDDGNTYLPRLSDGTLSISSGLIVSSSDERLKKDIEPLYSSLDKIMKLNPIIYSWIAKELDGPKRIGFTAQSVEPYFPELVGQPQEEGGFKGFHYADMVAVLTKGIQEQQQIIEQEKSKNAMMQEWICSQDNAPISLCN